MKINLNNVFLKPVSRKKISERNSEIGRAYTHNVWDIMYRNGDSIVRIGTGTDRVFDNGYKYLENIEIIPSMRGMGVGTYVFKKYFRGYTLNAGNDRAAELYKRIGVSSDNMSNQENRDLISTYHPSGVFKIRKSQNISEQDNRDDLDFKSIQLVKTGKGRTSNLFGIGVDTNVIWYNIVMRIKGKFVKIGECETFEFDNGIKNLNFIKVNPSLRNKGVGTYVIQKFFKGYFTSGNEKLFAILRRIAKLNKKFTSKENKAYNKAFNGRGIWKL